MLKTISVSDLRAQIKQILNEVSYGQAEYLVEKFGEPTAAIISLEDFRLLQQAKQQAKGGSFTDNLNAIHQALFASGYQPRTKEEIEAQIAAERAGWD